MGGGGGGRVKDKKNIPARENEMNKNSCTPINPEKFMLRPKKNSHKESDNDPPSPPITFLMVHPWSAVLSPLERYSSCRFYRWCTGCPKSSFLYFISLYFSTIGLGKQIIETKFVFQSNSPFSYLLCQFFDSNIRFVHFRAKGARARVYFPATYFLYSIARIARTPSLFFVNITKDKSP